MTGSNRNLVCWLLRGARPAAGLLTASLLARIGSQASGAALFVVPAYVLGLIAADASPAWRAALAAMVVLAAAKAALRYVEGVTGHVAAFTLLAQMRVRFYDALVPLAPAASEDESSGRLLATATKDIDRVEVFYAHTSAPAVTAVVLPTAAVAFAAAIAGPVPAAVLAAAAGIGLAGHLAVGRAQGTRAARKLLTVRSRTAQEIADSVRGRNEIVAFGAVGQRAERVDALGDEAAVALRSTGRGLGLRAAIQSAWQLTALLSLLVVGSGVAPAAMLACIALVPGIAPALATVESLGRSLPSAMASARRLRSLESRAPATSDPDEPAAVAFDGSVRMSGVSFAYPGRGIQVLDSFELSVTPGEIVAVVGATGSGKSTLSRLLTRVYDPDAGRIELSGTDVRRVSLAALRRAVTVVDQRTALLSGSVRENLLLGVPRASDEELRGALEAACSADDVLEMPDGLDTRIGEHGTRLSGGQAQRLALARGYLRRSPIMVLDEVTSHQDPITQRRMLERLRGRVRTAIVIAHRDATLHHVDRVVALKGGRSIPMESRPRP